MQIYERNSRRIFFSTIGGIRFCGCGCELVPVRGFLCLFWRETHTKGLRARFPTRPEEDEGRQSPKEVNRREQSTEVRGRRRSEKGDC